jgi:hypothetical protein
VNSILEPSVNGNHGSAFEVKVPPRGASAALPDLVEFLDQEVLPRLSAEQVFTHDAHDFQKTPTKWRGGCPHHESTSGTAFYLDPRTCRWRCPACQVGGGPLQYRYWLRTGKGSPRGQDFIDEVRSLSELAGVPFPKREWTPEQRERARRKAARQAVLETANAICQELLWDSEEGKAALAYLADRGLDADACRECGLGLYPEARKLRDRLLALGHAREDIRDAGVVSKNLTGYVTLPWLDERGTLLCLHGRWPGKDPPKGKPKTRAMANPTDAKGRALDHTKRSPLFLDRARDAGHDAVVLVEGDFDALVLHTLGDTRVVACLAACLSELQVDTLRRCGIKSVTVALDPDKAGDSGIGSCVKSLQRAGITPLVAPTLPEGLDPDEFALAHGIDAWRAHVAKRTHGYRRLALDLIEAQGPREPGDDGWGEDLIRESEALAADLPPGRELGQYFWPAIAEAVGLPVEELQAEAEPQAGRTDPMADPWEPPLPLSDAPAAPAFPVGVLPPKLARFVEDAAAALSCPADYLGVPLLALGGAAAGASRVLEIKPGWRERPALYCAIVGPPGSAKTPALKAVAAPVYAEQARLHQQYRREKVAHEEEDGPKPTERAVFVSDVTVEKLADLLQGNPRGVAMIRDELTAWVSAMNQYKSRGGADRQFFLSAWAGEPVSVHRKNQQAGPVFVPHPFLAVVGGLPPDLLAHLRGDRHTADGFLDRILFAFPEPPRAVGEDWACIAEEGEHAWGEALKALWALQPENDPEGGQRPQRVRLTGCGRKAWEAFTRGLADEVNAGDFPECLRGPWSKLKGYGARLALVVHLLRLATGEDVGAEVDGVSLGRAGELVAYFQGHIRKVYALMDADPRVSDARRVLRWITRKGLNRFTKRDAWQDLKGSFDTADDLDPPIALLGRHGYIRYVSEPREGPGRRPSPVYEVNPQTSPHNPQNPHN